MRRQIALLVVLVALLGCDRAPLAPEVRELRALRSAWKQLGIRDYDWDVLYLNYWFPGDWHRVEVRNGVVVRCTEIATGEEVAPESSYCRSVDQLFADAIALESEDVPEWDIGVEVDPSLAYIREYWGDAVQMADEEFVYFAQGLVVR